MSEPREIAAVADEVAPGLWHWRISNSGIGGNVSSSQALMTMDGCVLIDPVGLDASALAALPRPMATLLTARCHQRAACCRPGPGACPRRQGGADDCR